MFLVHLEEPPHIKTKFVKGSLSSSLYPALVFIIKRVAGVWTRVHGSAISGNVPNQMFNSWFTNWIINRVNAILYLWAWGVVLVLLCTLINLGTLQNWYAWQTKVTYCSITADPDWIEINNKNNLLSYEINEVHSMCLEWNVFPREIFPVLLLAFKIWVARCTQLFLPKQMSPPSVHAWVISSYTLRVDRFEYPNVKCRLAPHVW